MAQAPADGVATKRSKVLKEKIERKDKLIRLLKDLLRVKDLHALDGLEPQLLAIRSKALEETENLRKQLLETISCNKIILQQQEGYREEIAKLTKAIEEKNATIGLLKFTCGQSVNTTKELENEVSKQKETIKLLEKSVSCDCAFKKKRKLKDSPPEEAPPTPVSLTSNPPETQDGNSNPSKTLGISSIQHDTVLPSKVAGSHAYIDYNPSGSDPDESAPSTENCGQPQSCQDEPTWKACESVQPAQESSSSVVVEWMESDSEDELDLPTAVPVSSSFHVDQILSPLTTSPPGSSQSLPLLSPQLENSLVECAVFEFPDLLTAENTSTEEGSSTLTMAAAESAENVDSCDVESPENRSDESLECTDSTTTEVSTWLASTQTTPVHDDQPVIEEISELVQFDSPTMNLGPNNVNLASVCPEATLPDLMSEENTEFGKVTTRSQTQKQLELQKDPAAQVDGSPECCEDNISDKMTNIDIEATQLAPAENQQLTSEISQSKTAHNPENIDSENSTCIRTTSPQQGNVPITLTGGCQPKPLVETPVESTVLINSPDTSDELEGTNSSESSKQLASRELASRAGDSVGSQLSSSFRSLSLDSSPPTENFFLQFSSRPGKTTFPVQEELSSSWAYKKSENFTRYRDSGKSRDPPSSEVTIEIKQEGTPLVVKLSLPSGGKNLDPVLRSLCSIVGNVSRSGVTPDCARTREQRPEPVSDSYLPPQPGPSSFRFQDTSARNHSSFGLSNFTFGDPVKYEKITPPPCCQSTEWPSKSGFNNLHLQNPLIRASRMDVNTSQRCDISYKLPSAKLQSPTLKRRFGTWGSTPSNTEMLPAQASRLFSTLPSIQSDNSNQPAEFVPCRPESAEVDEQPSPGISPKRRRIAETSTPCRSLFDPQSLQKLPTNMVRTYSEDKLGIEGTPSELNVAMRDTPQVQFVAAEHNLEDENLDKGATHREENDFVTENKLPSTTCQGTKKPPCSYSRVDMEYSEDIPAESLSSSEDTMPLVQPEITEFHNKTKTVIDSDALANFIEPANPQSGTEKVITEDNRKGNGPASSLVILRAPKTSPNFDNNLIKNKIRSPTRQGTKKPPNSYSRVDWEYPEDMPAESLSSSVDTTPLAQPAITKLHNKIEAVKNSDALANLMKPTNPQSGTEKVVTENNCKGNDPVSPPATFSPPKISPNSDSKKVVPPIGVPGPYPFKKPCTVRTQSRKSRSVRTGFPKNDRPKKSMLNDIRRQCKNMRKHNPLLSYVTSEANQCQTPTEQKRPLVEDETPAGNQTSGDTCVCKFPPPNCSCEIDRIIEELVYCKMPAPLSPLPSSSECDVRTVLQKSVPRVGSGGNDETISEKEEAGELTVVPQISLSPESVEEDSERPADENCSSLVVCPTTAPSTLTIVGCKPAEVPQLLSNERELEEGNVEEDSDLSKSSIDTWADCPTTDPEEVAREPTVASDCLLNGSTSSEEDSEDTTNENVSHLRATYSTAPTLASVDRSSANIPPVLNGPEIGDFELSESSTPRCILPVGTPTIGRASVAPLASSTNTLQYLGNFFHKTRAPYCDNIASDDPVPTSPNETAENSSSDSDCDLTIDCLVQPRLAGNPTDEALSKMRDLPLPASYFGETSNKMSDLPLPANHFGGTSNKMRDLPLPASYFGETSNKMSDLPLPANHFGETSNNIIDLPRPPDPTDKEQSQFGALPAPPQMYRNEEPVAASPSSVLQPPKFYSGVGSTGVAKPTPVVEPEAKPAKLVVFSTRQTIYRRLLEPKNVLSCSTDILTFAKTYRPDPEPKRKHVPWLKDNIKLKIKGGVTEYFAVPYSTTSMDKAKATFRETDPNHLGKVLCESVSTAHIKEPLDQQMIVANMTAAQKKAVLLVIALANGNFEYFDSILSAMEEFLIPTLVPHAEVQPRWASGNVATLYAVLCSSQGFLLRVQSFIYDLLYARQLSSFKIIYRILMIMPNAIPRAHRFLGPLTYTIAYLIMKHGVSSNIPPGGLSGRSITELRTTLLYQYKYWFSNDVTRDMVIDELFANLYVKGTDKAVVLLCKSQGFKWTFGVTRKYLFPMLDKWTRGDKEDEDENTIALAVRILGMISRGFAVAVCDSFVTSSLEKLQCLLHDEQSILLADAVVESLSHFRRLDGAGVTKILESWSPHQVTISSVKLVKQILGRKSSR